MSSHSDAVALVLALCGLACAIPPSSHPPTPCARPDDVAIVVVVSEPSAQPDDEGSADVAACTSYCSELGSTCPGTLTGGKRCLDACTAWPDAALDCREDWLANGSCIGAALDSPTCAI